MFMLNNDRNYKLTMIVALFVVAVIVTISATQPPKANAGSVTASLIQYRIGEHTNAPMVIDVGAALAEYRSDEKAIFTNAFDANNTLWVYRLGEKNAALSPESAMTVYRQGEKIAK